jgi:hypothetical protein
MVFARASRIGRIRADFGTHFNAMTKLHLMLAAAAALVAATPAGAAEMLTNGDFEAGNTGFYSSYGNSPGNYWPEGVYGVATNPQSGHGLFSSFGDHTSGTGLMMVVNGASAENAVVWGQSGLNVAQNTNYVFSFWLGSAYPVSPAILTARINGVWQTSEAPATVGMPGWTQFSYVWNSEANTTATVELVDRNLEYHGNDFVLDDMSFSGGAVPEPATWAMMIIGFGAVGALIRRRRMAPAAI